MVVNTLFRMDEMTLLLILHTKRFNEVTGLAMAQCPKWMFYIYIFTLKKEVFAKVMFSTYNVKDNDF